MNPAVKRGLTGLSAAAIVLATPLVMKWEGKRNDPYDDVRGIRTFCFGETANVQERHYSDAECRTVLVRSIQKHGNDGIAPCVPAGAPDEVQAAFLSIGYNVGVSAFCRSSMSRLAFEGNYPAACAAISKYVFVAGKDCRDPKNRCSGIASRRADERRLCEAGLS